MDLSGKLAIGFAAALIAGFAGLLHFADAEIAQRNLGCRGEICLESEVHSGWMLLRPTAKARQTVDHFQVSAACLPGQQTVAPNGVLRIELRSDRDSLETCRVRVQSCQAATADGVAGACSAMSQWDVGTQTFSNTFRTIFAKGRASRRDI